MPRNAVELPMGDLTKTWPLRWCNRCGKRTQHFNLKSSTYFAGGAYWRKIICGDCKSRRTVPV